MLVEEIMSTDLVTCPAEATLQTGAERMLANRVGSVVVVSDGIPAGIVTETDAIHAGAVTERPFSEIPVEKVMSQPLITISPRKSVRHATQQMAKDGVKKLAVVEETDLVGILTTQDIVDNYHELKAEVTKLVRQHRRGAAGSRDRSFSGESSDPGSGGG